MKEISEMMLRNNNQEIISNFIKKIENKNISNESNNFTFDINKEINDEKMIPLNLNNSNKIEKSLTRDKIFETEKNLTITCCLHQQNSKGNSRVENFEICEESKDGKNKNLEKTNKNNSLESKTKIKGFLKAITSLNKNNNEGKKIRSDKPNEISYSINNYNEKKSDFELDSDNDVFLGKPLTDRGSKRNEKNIEIDGISN